MTRVRISTTVDGDNLATARALVSKPDSELLDEALAALIERREAAHEREALERFPYEDDPDLAWETPRGPSLPYDGEVPEDVIELAKQRRRKK